MSAPGLVVVFDGPSCVGRTTTAAALQLAWPSVRTGPLLTAGITAMLAGFGPARRRWSDLVLPDVATSTGELAASWGPLGRELVVGMHRSAAAWARAGTDVVLTHVLLDRAIAADLAEACAGLGVLMVGLTCDEDVLEDRAQELRRSPAAALAQARTARGIVEHDLVLDTTQASTDELVGQLLEELARWS